MTLLLVLLFVKHFLADFPLQTQSMVVGKGQKYNWVGWLASHCAVHAGFTFAILLFFEHPGLAFFLAFAEFYIHLNVDRIKLGTGGT